MNHITTSKGERITRAAFDKRIRKAKELKLYLFYDENGEYKCEQCGINEANARIDCSHDIPVSKCIKNGTAELAYDFKNITLLCRKCHKIKDGLNLKFNG